VLDFLRTFWVNPIKHPDFFWAFAGRLLLFTGYFGVTGYNLYVLNDYIGIGDLAASTGYVPILGLLGLAGTLPAILVSGPISDKVGRRKIFVFISSVVVAVGLLVPWVMPTIGGMMLMSVIIGVGFGAFMAVDQALMTEVLPSADSYAKDLGVVNIAATLPQTLAPAVGGAIVLAFGYAGLFPVGIVLSVLGAFCVFMIKAVK
jgi:MFS family permease